LSHILYRTPGTLVPLPFFLSEGAYPLRGKGRGMGKRDGSSRKLALFFEKSYKNTTIFFKISLFAYPSPAPFKISLFAYPSPAPSLNNREGEPAPVTSPCLVTEMWGRIRILIRCNAGIKFFAKINRRYRNLTCFLKVKFRVCRNFTHGWNPRLIIIFRPQIPVSSCVSDRILLYCKYAVTLSFSV